MASTTPRPKARPCFKQRQQRQLRRRIRHRREVAEDFVHVEQRAQAGGAGLRAHPAEHLIEQQRDEEHALRVAEVRDGKDGHARLARWRVVDALDVERLAFQPRAEAGRGEQVVDGRGEREAILRRIKRFHVHHADALDARGLNFLNQRGEVEIAAVLPGALNDVGEEDGFAALRRVGFDAHQTEQAADGGVDAFAQQLAVVEDRLRRRGEGIENGDGNAGVAARRVDGELGRFAQPPDALAVLVPTGEALLPQLGLLRGELGRRKAFLARLVGIDPRLEIRRAQIGKRQQQIREVALRDR